MKKLIDKRIIIINAALLILGLISGIIFLLFTSNLDKLIIKEEITDFFTQINTGSSASISNLFISFKYNIMYIFIITISSIIYLFSPLVLLINFYKGFLIGFLMSSIVLTYKLKGIFLSMLSLIPHHLIMCITIIIYSSIMLHFSYKLMKGTYNGESINLKAFIKKISVLFLGSTIICLLASILEIYLNPLIVKLIL